LKIVVKLKSLMQNNNRLLFYLQIAAKYLQLIILNQQFY